MRIWRLSDLLRVVDVSRGDKAGTHGGLSQKDEEELKGTVEAEAAQRRAKECQDKAAERGRKRAKSSPQMDAPPQAGVAVVVVVAVVALAVAVSARHQHRVSSTGGFVEGVGSSKAGEQRKANGGHPEGPDFEYGKWMRTERNKRKLAEEDGKNM